MCALHHPPLLSVQQPGLEKAGSGEENFWKALLPPTPTPPANSSRNLILKGERAAKTWTCHVVSPDSAGSFGCNFGLAFLYFSFSCFLGLMLMFTMRQ